MNNLAKACRRRRYKGTDAGISAFRYPRPHIPKRCGSSGFSDSTASSRPSGVRRTKTTWSTYAVLLYQRAANIGRQNAVARPFLQGVKRTTHRYSLTKVTARSSPPAGGTGLPRWRQPRRFENSQLNFLILFAFRYAALAAVAFVDVDGGMRRELDQT